MALALTYVDGSDSAFFTDQQKAKIRRYLGYATQDSLGSKTQSVNTLNERLQQAHPPAFITEVQAILSALDNINEQTIAAIAKSRIVRADVIEFDYGAQGKILQQQGGAYVNELANMLGVEIMFSKYLSGGRNISIRSS